MNLNNVASLGLVALVFMSILTVNFFGCSNIQHWFAFQHHEHSDENAEEHQQAGSHQAASDHNNHLHDASCQLHTEPAGSQSSQVTLQVLSDYCSNASALVSSPHLLQIRYFVLDMPDHRHGYYQDILQPPEVIS